MTRGPCDHDPKVARGLCRRCYDAARKDPRTGPSTPMAERTAAAAGDHPRVTFTLPRAIVEALGREADRTGEAKSRIAAEALRRYLGTK